MEENVMFELKDVCALARNELRLDILWRALFNNARLNYSGEKLAFDDDELCAVLRAMFPDDYDAVLSDLQERKSADAKAGDAF